MRSAILQARVRPEIKFAGELLRSIGLTMTEAMELFLRRLIVDQKLPFEVAEPVMVKSSKRFPDLIAAASPPWLQAAAGSGLCRVFRIAVLGCNG